MTKWLRLQIATCVGRTELHGGGKLHHMVFGVSGPMCFEALEEPMGHHTFFSG